MSHVPECLQNISQEQVDAVFAKKIKDHTPEEKKIYKSVLLVKWETRGRVPVSEYGPDTRPLAEVLPAYVKLLDDRKASKAAEKAAKNATVAPVEATA